MQEKYRKGTLKDLENGAKIKLINFETGHIEQKAYDFVLKQDENWTWKGKSKAEWLEYFKINIPRKKTWYDYATFLVSSYPINWVREGWKKKMISSINHWKNRGSAIQESVRDALLVLHYSKNKKYLEYPDEYFKGIWWDQVGLTEISRMPIVKIFKYLQDSPENQVRYYITELLKDLRSEDENLKKEAMEEIMQNKTLRELLFGKNGDMGNIGKTPYSMRYIQEPWCSLKDLVNIPSGGDARQFIVNGQYRKAERVRNKCTHEEFLTALENGGRRYFHDEVKNSPSWKRLVIAIQRKDSNLTYMGFSPTYEQQMIRQQGMAAFAKSQEEKEKALKKYAVAKAAKEKEDNKENN